jgi:hypothetical protein
MYRSNLPNVKSQMQRATEAGLIAAAAVVENKVKEGLAGGYTTGNFVTGTSVSSVNHSEPEVGPNGAFILVGTDVMYALFWEVGFVPARGVFSPGIGGSTHGPIGMQRKEVWLPALFSTRAEQLAAFQRTYQRFMGGGGSGFGQRAASPRSPR